MSLSQILTAQSRATKWLSASNGLVALWVLFMISLPIVNWTWGLDALRQGMGIAVILQALAVLSVLLPAWGRSATLRAFVIVAIFTLLVEAVGTATGLPFGRYTYTSVLQPQLLHVPLIIPLAWFMMLFPAWATAQSSSDAPLTFAAISASAMVAWDLMLDPQMVTYGFWVWQQPGLYFGIPLLNFVGWWLTAFFLSLLLVRVIRPKHPFPTVPMLIIFTITWFLETFGLALFWGQRGPASVGGIVMGLFVISGWRHVLRRIVV